LLHSAAQQKLRGVADAEETAAAGGEGKA